MVFGKLPWLCFFIFSMLDCRYLSISIYHHHNLCSRFVLHWNMQFFASYLMHANSNIAFASTIFLFYVNEDIFVWYLLKLRTIAADNITLTIITWELRLLIIIIETQNSSTHNITLILPLHERLWARRRACLWKDNKA